MNKWVKASFFILGKTNSPIILCLQFPFLILKRQTSEMRFCGEETKSPIFISNLHEPHRKQELSFWDHFPLVSIWDKWTWFREPEILVTFRCTVQLSQGDCTGEIELMDSLFHGFSIQAHCLFPFTLYFNSREATNEKPESYNGSERSHPAHFVFKVSRCPLLTLRGDTVVLGLGRQFL